MATVVVCLSGTAFRSSTSAPAAVSTASVVRGTISETEPTKVVLPTPKPPAMTILTDVVARLASTVVERAATLELAKSTQHPFQKISVRSLVRRAVYQYQADISQVADQNPYHPDGDVQIRRDLGDRPAARAHPADGMRLRRPVRIELLA